MNYHAWPLVILAAVIGCTPLSKSSTTRMKWTDGKTTFSYESPKDQTIQSLTLDPKTGAVTIQNLSSQVDQAAVAAARDARIADSQASQAIVTGSLALAQDAIKAKLGTPAVITLPAQQNAPTSTQAQ